MTQQPEALRLADRLDSYATGDAHQQDIEQAAAELRWQHEELQEQSRLLGISGEREMALRGRIERLEQALRQVIEVTKHLGPCPATLDAAKQALGEA